MEALYAVFAWSLLLGWAIGAGAGLFSRGDPSCASIYRRLRAFPLAWLAGYFLLVLDSLEVLYWHMH